jgi:hypothetical protein
VSRRRTGQSKTDELRFDMAKGREAQRIARKTRSRGSEQDYFARSRSFRTGNGREGRQRLHARANKYCKIQTESAAGRVTDLVRARRTPSDDVQKGERISARFAGCDLDVAGNKDVVAGIGGVRASH